MHYVEKLYLSGFVSYPRTETSRYAAGFDLAGTLTRLQAAEWLPEARRLLMSVGGGDSADAALPGLSRQQANETLLSLPRQDGEDAGDHPPITPVKLATPKQCGDECGWLLYRLICRQFVTSLSEDCAFETARVRVRSAPGRGASNRGRAIGHSRPPPPPHHPAPPALLTAAGEQRRQSAR